MGDFYYILSSELWSRNGSVSGPADADYLTSWLADDNPGRPVRATSGTASWTVTNSSGEVGLVAFTGHNLDAGKTITISGGVSATLTTASTLPPDGIPLNPFATVTPASISTLTAAVTGNSTTIVTGGIYAGKYRTLERNLKRDTADFTESQLSVGGGGDFDSAQPYDQGVTQRTLAGSNVYTLAGLQAIQVMFESTRGNSRPLLIVPDSDVNDAWVVRFTRLAWTGKGRGHYDVSMTFEEYPRSRW